LTKPPYPPTDGTRKKLWEDVIKGLAAEFDLDLLLIGPEKLSPETASALGSIFNRIISFSISKPFFICRAIRSLISGKPLQTEAYGYKAASSWLKTNIDNYQAAYFHTIRTGKYLEQLTVPQINKVLLDLNDAISLNYQDAQRLAPFPWRLIYRWEKNRVARYELKLLSLVKYVNVVSNFDEQYLQANCRQRNQVCPDFLHISSSIEKAPSEHHLVSDRPRLLFFGNLNYPPNRDALIYFLRNIWPSIKKTIPLIELSVAGQGGRKLRKKNNEKEINFLGFVPDLDALFSQINFTVAPLRFGAGVPTKILESLVRGVPVLTTLLGSRGLAAPELGEEKRGLVCLDEKNPEEWVMTIRSLLSDGTRRQKLSDAASNFSAINYDRNVIQEKYRAAMRLICEGH